MLLFFASSLPLPPPIFHLFIPNSCTCQKKAVLLHSQKFFMATICAISTAYGAGGIAVIRVSGEQAISIVDSLFAGRVRLCNAAANTIHFGRIQRGNEVLDEVLCSVFRAPHSFTGEDTVEIACHGSLYIQQELLRWLIDAGCKAAEPGEFTRRAFLNGKMDLTQAEAVADLIAAQSKAEKDLALSQLRGSVSNELASLRERLLHFTSLIELELDFADHEELEFADRTELSQLADEIEKNLAALLASFRTGNAIRNGIPVAIIGAPNVGKSTLLNALLGEQRAIVSDIQGTTRDTIEDTLVIDGILFRLIDTAGIRDTKDTIEQLGVERSKQAAQKAQIIIFLSDNGQWTTDIVHSGTIIKVLNKSDLGVQGEGILISAKNGEIEPLKRELVRIARASLQTSAVMLSNARHYDAINRAHDAIVRVQEGMRQGLSGELLSMDLQDCLSALGEVTGQITNAEVLSNIFSKFCIGK
jgi:tRNA modification GTPase